MASASVAFAFLTSPLGDTTGLGNTLRTCSKKNDNNTAVLETFLLSPSWKTRAASCVHSSHLERGSLICPHWAGTIAIKYPRGGVGEEQVALKIDCRNHSWDWPYPSEQHRHLVRPSGPRPGQWRCSERKRRHFHFLGCYPSLGIDWSKILHLLQQERPLWNGVSPGEE